MSGEKTLANSRKPKPGPLETSLSVEDDKRLFGCTGAGSICGAVFVAWAILTVPKIPDILVIWDWGDGRLNPRDTVPIYVKPPVDYHRKLNQPRIAKNNAKPGRTGKQRPAPKTAKPSEKQGWLGQNLITSRGDRLDVNAYDLVPKSVRDLDLDKLSEMPILKRTPHSGIGGRRGKQSHEFNLEYFEDGEGGGGGITDIPTGIGPGKIPTQVKRSGGISKIGSTIDYSESNNARSSASILSVIRSRSPGLRHIYNNFLKQHPGFAGKITLHFEIAPGGDVVAVGIASSTTHVRDFDQEILRQVKSWRFEPVKSAGNDNVTVPINFSE